VRRLSVLVPATAALAGAVAVASFASRPAEAVPQGGTSLEVSVSRAGFQPSSLTIRRGETVRVVLTSTDGEHCFAIDALRIEKRIVPGRPTRFDLIADTAGTYTYYCCLESGAAAERERGRLTVAD
jgi:heme/copper-type cytochrome/quinol oxidase subunit 2